MSSDWFLLLKGDSAMHTKQKYVSSLFELFDIWILRDPINLEFILRIPILNHH